MDRRGDGWWDRRKGEAIVEIDDEFLDRFASSFPLVHGCYVTSLENFSDVQRILRDTQFITTFHIKEDRRPPSLNFASSIEHDQYLTISNFRHPAWLRFDSPPSRRVGHPHQQQRNTHPVLLSRRVSHGLLCLTSRRLTKLTRAPGAGYGRIGGQGPAAAKFKVTPRRLVTNHVLWAPTPRRRSGSERE